MKNLVVPIAALILVALVGCGPSAEQKKMVADLTTEVTSMMNDAKSSLGDLDKAAGDITTSLSGADSLMMKYPKDTEAINGAVTQLKSAKDRLMSVKDNVSSWINAYKAPDLTKMKFDQVIADLKKNKDELTTATSEIKGALSAASAAIDGYKNVASTLMSKVAAKTPMKKK